MNNLKKRADHTFCCVPQCNSRACIEPDLCFHRIPGSKNMKQDDNTAKRRKEWIRLLRIGKEVGHYMKVCSKHFKETDYILPDVPTKRPHLKSTAIPSLNLPVLTTDNVQARAKKQKRADERHERYNTIIQKKSAASVIRKDSELQGSTEGEARNTAVEALLNLASMAFTSDMEGTSPNSDDNARNVTPEDQPQFLNMLHSLKDQSTQVSSGDFVTQILIPTDKLSSKQLNSLTGLHSVKLLEQLTEYVQMELQSAPKRCMSIKDRIMLSLMRMKLNISFVVLSVLFGCTSTTCKVIFSETIHALAVTLRSMIYWPSKEEIMCNIPVCFKNFFNVRTVLDCTEIPVGKPKCLKCQIRTYSQYKGMHTIKYLIGASPGGIITYVSKGYGGRASDKEIFRQSGLVEMVEPHVDAFMVDKGFLIDDICEERGINIIRPPFLREKKQLSPQEANLTRNIARARVHIERIIQRIKAFKLLHYGRIPWTMISLADDMMIIACGLANLGRPVLSNDKF
ncbi:hypothetical protein X975_16882, partial [Stegodyphus mimosarum]